MTSSHQLLTTCFQMSMKDLPLLIFYLLNVQEVSQFNLQQSLSTGLARRTPTAMPT